MDEAAFAKLIAGARIAAHVNSDYARGYELGARRAHHGIEFDPRRGLHADWVRRGTRHDPRPLLNERRGYRDGFAGRRANPEGLGTRGTETRTGSASLNLRIPIELAARVDAAADAAGSSQSAWVREAIEAKLGGG